jgi:hypothetical protein
MLTRYLRNLQWCIILCAALGTVPAASAQSPTDTTVVASDSARSESEFKAASARYSPVVRGCYEREGLRADPALSATVEVGVTVAPTGTVRDISVDTLEVKGVGMANVARCVSQAAATWKFQPGAYAEERAILTFKLLAPRSASTQ